MYLWTKYKDRDKNNFHKMTIFRIMENGSLFIEQALAAHEGHYLCKADNGVAHGSTLSKLAEIKVNGKSNSLNYDNIVD